MFYKCHKYSKCDKCDKCDSVTTITSVTSDKSVADMFWYFLWYIWAFGCILLVSESVSCAAGLFCQMRVSSILNWLVGLAFKSIGPQTSYLKCCQRKLLHQRFLSVAKDNSCILCNYSPSL